MARISSQQRIALTVLVAALGYFVDVFDLQLFSMLRGASLHSLGLSPDEVTSVGAQLLNWQMGGMLIGGLLWGVLGDRRGRVYVLFGTILLYSVGNIANAFVTNVAGYAAARFFTGLGLAGEIGAGITLAVELMPKNTRSYATAAIVTCGVLGPVAASFMADAVDWRSAYIGGGILGLLLLVLRISVNESNLFRSLNAHSVARGRFLMLFANRQRLLRYVACVLIAVPTWYVVGVLAIFSPEMGMALDIAEPLKASTAVVSCYVGITIGGLLSGLFSQFFANRKKVMGVFIAGAAAASVALFGAHGISAAAYYAILLIAGIFCGYWTLFMTTTAEQFGTNLRATAATTAPNFVRASIILDTILITSLKPSCGFLVAAEINGVICFALAFLALWKLPETFHQEMDFIER
jgi:MFS family permease